MVELLKDRAVLKISGTDAQTFLQGQVTNDVVKNQYSYNFVLNNQGRYLYDLFIFCDHNQQFYIDVHKNLAELLIQRLLMYTLRSNVIIEDVSDDFSVLYSQEKMTNVLFSLQDPRNNMLGFRSIVRNSTISIDIIYTDNLYFDDKYNLVIIDGYSDLIHEKSIPVEYSADDFNAISYQKGCYIGQEVISRVKYQGAVRKKIYQLQFGTEIALPCGSHEVTDRDGNKIGILCSSYKRLSIALLRESKYLNLDKKIALVAGQAANILPPPWRR